VPKVSSVSSTNVAFVIDVSPEAALPHRPDRMDHPAGGKVAGDRHDGIAGRAVAILSVPGAQVRQDRGAAGLVDGTVHPAARDQPLICCLPDRLCRDLRDAAMDDLHASAVDVEVSHRRFSCRGADVGRARAERAVIAEPALRLESIGDVAVAGR
jgi:hypothetical protein